MADSPRNLYQWVELPEFTHYARAISTNPEEWDLIQIAIEDNILVNPHAVSHPVGDDTDLLYFLTWEHPGTSTLPRLVVIFRIDREPTETEIGILEAHAVFSVPDLEEEAARSTNGGGPHGP